MTASSPEHFVAALRRYVGQLEYRPGKTCFVVETGSGPKGFTDCAGLPLIGLRDLGVLPKELDLNFPHAQNREGEILRILRRLGKRVPEGTRFHLGDVLVSGTTGRYHVMTVSQVDWKNDVLRVVEAPRAHGVVCEHTLDDYEQLWIRSAFRLF